MDAWRLAQSLVELRDQVNAAHPGRPTQSDGTIGDAAHASTGNASDHNPWIHDASGEGVVRAFDITAADWSDDLAEHLRILGQSGDNRLIDHGYIIWNNRICGYSPENTWDWRPYSGVDPHTSHIHVSVGRTGYDNSGDWLYTGQTNPLTAEGDDKMLVNFHPGGWYLAVGGRLIQVNDTQRKTLVSAGVPTQDLPGINKGLYDSAK